MNRNTLCRADELLAGAALALLLRGRYTARAFVYAKPLLPAALIALLAERAAQSWVSNRTNLAWAGSLIMSATYTTLMVIAAALILYCFLPDSPIRRVFEWKPLRSLGKYSYGLYVLHVIFLEAATYLLLEPLRNMLHGKAMARLVIAVAVFGFSCAAAYGSFHFYEKRFLRLKRYFDYGPRPSEA